MPSCASQVVVPAPLPLMLLLLALALLLSRRPVVLQGLAGRHPVIDAAGFASCTHLPVASKAEQYVRTRARGIV
jgi:uncharacterized protein (TIGR03382 family)